MDTNYCRCDYCKKIFFRSDLWSKLNKYYGYSNYCSLYCLSKSKIKRVTLECENPTCRKIFSREQSQISLHNYCSQSCAAHINNTKYRKRIALTKFCRKCGKKFIGGAIKYCSTKCQSKAKKLTKNQIIFMIKKFYRVNGSIPLKIEVTHYSAARRCFGTWNNAIKAAGFSPNPVLFAHKWTANDGDKCDSLAEKIIDDWLYARRIEHVRNYPYPNNPQFKADFKVGDYWIEFFGLSGELKRYDEIKKQKLKLIKNEHLNLISLYPNDLFPKNMLNKLLLPVNSL